MNKCKMLEIITPNFTFADERGTFNELCQSGWQQVNVSESKKGAFRGGHYHKESKEAFFIVNGVVDVKVESEVDDATEEYTFKKGDFFVIYPYTSHSFDFKEDTVMLALYDIPVIKSDGTKDIFDRGN